MDAPQQPNDDDFITIIGATMAEITGAFREQGLAERQFAIVHRTGRHRFTRVTDGASETMFEGEPLIAATFARRAGA
jgi:hypothetical protein